MPKRINRIRGILKPVSYTHLDVYKRQSEYRGKRTLRSSKMAWKSRNIGDWRLSAGYFLHFSEVSPGDVLQRNAFFAFSADVS